MEGNQRCSNKRTDGSAGQHVGGKVSVVITTRPAHQACDSVRDSFNPQRLVVNGDHRSHCKPMSHMTGRKRAVA